MSYFSWLRPIDASVSKPPNENTLTLLEDICAHFQNTKDSVQIMS